MAHWCARTHRNRARPGSTIEDAKEGAISPTHEEIARLAFSYWEGRGCQGGSPWEDWFRAEEELKRK